MTPASRRPCPHCNGVDTEAFYALDQVPVTCTSIFPSAAQARAVPKGGIELCVCRRCGFIFNRAFDPALGEIGAQYESSQAASKHFGGFAQALAEEWVTRYGLAGQRVLEIGCGDAQFLGRMLDAGIANAVGIDPLADPAAESRHGSLQLIADHFDSRYINSRADALVCRHTLEHIQDVAGFARLLRLWAGNNPRSVVLIEVPDAQRILSERAFWDVYYEHCNYFTPDTLRQTLEHAGLEVMRLERAYSDQYLIAEARLCSTSGEDRPFRSASRAVLESHAFAADVHKAITRGQSAFNRLADNSTRVVLWQGAAKTVGLITALPDPGVIDSAVDASPARHGKFLPGSGLAVHAPEKLRDLRPGHIVLMNPVYLAEVRATVASLGLDTPVHSVNDLLRAG